MFGKIIGLILILIMLISPVYGDINNYSFNIMKDSMFNTTVYVNDSGKEGSTILVIGGVHGDEVAGIHAAENLISYTPKKGTLIVIPKANMVACNNNNRTEYYMDDLNRSFLGSENGTVTQKLAWEIVNVIKEFKPAMIVDLHESRGKYDESTSYIGQSVIISEIDSPESVEIAFLIVEKMDFTVLSGAPKGSLNKEASEMLNIPVITIETSMDQELDKRVSDQLAIIKIILNYYGMEDW